MKRLILLVLVPALASTAAAQTAPRSYTIGAHLGYTQFQDAAALDAAPTVGVDAVYNLGAGILGDLELGLGLTFSAARPLTRGDQFPVVAFDFGDTTFLYTVSQRVTMTQYGAKAQVAYPVGRARVFGYAGGGAYTMMPDARANLGVRTFTSPMVQFGGGVSYAVNQSLGLRLEVRDAMLLDYDRSQLDPTVGYARDRRIGDALPPPTSPSDRVHAFQTSIVFSYIPNRNASAGGDQ